MPRAALSQAEIDSFREELCAVATRRFAERGYGGVTLRGLAAELGCSPMTPYRYFRDRDEIFAAVRAAAFGRFADLQEAVAARVADPVERLRALGNAYLRFALDEPESYRVMFELTQPAMQDYPELQSQGQRAWLTLRTAVATAIDAGRVSGDPDVVAHVFWAGLHGAVALHLAGKLQVGRSLHEITDPLMNVLIRGVVPEGTDPPPDEREESP